MAHTPGPWTVKGGDLPGTFLEIISPGYRKETDAEHVVCQLRRWRRPTPEDDARLIAAAPELLAALQDWVELYDAGQLVIEGEADEGDDPIVGSAKAAIAKAEGRTQ